MCLSKVPIFVKSLETIFIEKLQSWPLTVKLEISSKDDLIRFNWLKNNVFLTKTSINQIDDQQFFVRIGANDPDFNLRNDPGLITRRNAKNTVFISSIEAHGKYSPVSEFATNSRSEIKNLKQEFHNDFYTSFSVELLNNTKYLFIIAHNSDDTEKKHSLTVGTDSFNWKGPYYFKKLWKNSDQAINLILVKILPGIKLEKASKDK